MEIFIEPGETIGSFKASNGRDIVAFNVPRAVATAAESGDSDAWGEIEDAAAEKLSAFSARDWDSRVNSILSGNAKLEKHPAGVSIVNSGVSMAPAKRSGAVNVCPHATAACIAACVLWFAGRTVTATVRAAAVARTMLWHLAPARFYARLGREIRAQEKRAVKLGARSFVRLNVASDIDHGTEFPALFSATEFYGYTKDTGRMLRYLAGEYPGNYHESLSIHEQSAAADVFPVLRAGGNVVVVVDSYYWGPSRRYGTLPAAVCFVSPTGERVTVAAVDGDISDIRTPEFDGRGVAVCLRLKGASKKTRDGARKSGFARPWSLGGKEHSSRGMMPPARGTLVVRLK